MKILQVISSGGMYGAESVILNLARGLTAAGHPCVLGVFANSPNPNLQLHQRALEAGIPSYPFPCKGQLDPTAIRRIRDLATETGADIIHTHGYKADVYTRMAMLDYGVPLVSTCHNWLDEHWRTRLYGVVDRYVLRSFPRVVAVSEEVRRRLLEAGVPPERIRIIPNGIDLRPFKVERDSDPVDWCQDRPAVVGMVARLSAEKGVDLFLRAAAQVAGIISHAKFVVVGDGPDREELEALIDQLRLRPFVSMLGPRNDMPAQYASFDLLVSSSRKEGLPVAILEAMASGLPLVATAVGDVLNVVRNGETGILLPTGDPGPLASAIVDLLCDREKRRRLGSVARQLVESQYSAERMSNDYLDTYKDAVTALWHRTARRLSDGMDRVGEKN
jgi:glycosyltransferase involved in cell wall biosynthesis